MKSYNNRTVLAALGATTALTAFLIAQSAHAQTRPESVSRAMLSIERGCPITRPLTDAEIKAQPNRIAPIIGTILAGVAGNLVTSGINAVGNALESASQEKAFVAEGIGSFTAYRVDNDGNPTQKWRPVPDLGGEALPDGQSQTAARCLVLIVPGSASAKGKSPGPALTVENIKGAFGGIGIDDGRAANVETRFRAMGLTQLPALYVEAELIRASDGMAIQPVLIRYAAPISGAPKRAAPTELHISFAVPGAPDTTDIGTLYGLARMPLPRIAPAVSENGVTGATLFNRTSLLPYTSVVVPMRATAGLTDTTVTARNAVVTAIETNKASQAQLREALRLAQRKLDQNKDASKRVELTNALEDAQLAFTESGREGAGLIQRAKQWEPLDAGSTNVKARFVVIRDANQFGLAIAKALKSQADAAGTAVTERLKPKPEWTSEDTAYVEAQSAVRAAERAIDEAITAGETSKVPGLQDALIKAKAKANEAAVAAGRDAPYAIIA